MYNSKKSSGKKTGDSLIASDRCYYYGFTCIPGGIDRVITIYDAVSAVGTEIEDFSVDGTKKTDGHSHSVPIKCENGIYLSISGGSAIVYYRMLKSDT